MTHDSERFATFETSRRCTPVCVASLLSIIIVALGLVAPAAAKVDASPVVTIESVRLSNRLVTGGAATLDVVARIQPGWHINSAQPTSRDYIPTRLTVTTPPDVIAGAVTYPPGRDVSLAFAKGEPLSVFTGIVQIKAGLKAASGFHNDSAGQPVTVRLDFQACNDNECLRPASVSATLNLASATLGDASVSGQTNSGIGASDGESAALSNIFATRGYLLGFLVVLLGGLALNLTPCVYPLIGVTIAYFGFEGGGPRKVVMLALVYVLGIALTFSAVGVAVAMSGGLFGSALQNPFVLSAIALMLLALAASSFGLFTLQPPRWLMQRAGTARPGYLGALTMGLGMGVVAAPCIGPIVLGLLIVVQRSADPFFGFALFFTLAIGLGAPYVGLALAAGTIRKLPKAGEWLAWVEQLFGLVLVGFAIYFLDPVVGHHLIARLLPYYAAGAGIFLGFASPHGRNWRPFLVFRWVLGVVALIFLVQRLVIAGAPRQQLTFQTFSAGLLQNARAQGRPVVVDFSADWCIPCREMDKTTFTDPAVVREAARFVRLRADLTAENPTNQDLIKRFNIRGVPTTMFIDASGTIREQRVGYVGPAEFLKFLRTDD